MYKEIIFFLYYPNFNFRRKMSFFYYIIEFREIRKLGWRIIYHKLFVLYLFIAMFLYVIKYSKIDHYFFIMCLVSLI